MLPVIVGGIGHDHRGRRCDVVAATGGDVPHRDDHGLLVNQTADVGVHDVAGQRRAAGRIDPQDDSLDVVIVEGLVDGILDILWRDSAVSQGAFLPRIHDHPAHEDQADRRLVVALFGGRGTAEHAEEGKRIAHIGLGGRGLSAIVIDGGGVVLVFEVALQIGQLHRTVDELGVDGLFRAEDADVDQFLDILGFEVAALGDLADQLVVQTVDQVGHLLLEFVRRAGAGVRLARPLVRPDVQDVRLDAELLQHVLVEPHLQVHARDDQVPRRGENHLVAGAGNGVVVQVRIGKVGVDRLACFAQPADRRP